MKGRVNKQKVPLKQHYSIVLIWDKRLRFKKDFVNVLVRGLTAFHKIEHKCRYL